MILLSTPPLDNIAPMLGPLSNQSRWLIFPFDTFQPARVSFGLGCAPSIRGIETQFSGAKVGFNLRITSRYIPI